MLRNPFILIRLLALLFLIFVVYGSLVPLEFSYIPLESAVNRFKNISFLDLGIGSRADWVANLLLFIPLGFFLTGSAWSGSKGVRIFLAAIIFIFCTCLAFGIEFTQLYFPRRTVSQNDILAEMLGGLFGILAWWRWGEWFVSFYRQWYQVRGVVAVSEKIFWVYVFILVGYNIMPLDLTISPVEIYHKWHSGNVNFIPFAFYSDDPAQIIYDLFADVLIWIPLSVLLMLSGKARPVVAVFRIFQVALVLEFLQFFVYSRVTDITDLFTAVFGGIVGMKLFALFKSTRSVNDEFSSNNRLLLATGLLLVWTLIDMVIFWYPFEFNWDKTFVLERIRYAVSETPLTAYYLGSEYRAITEFIHKIGFFIPFGAIPAWLRGRQYHHFTSVWINRLLVMFLLLPPLLIEGGQLGLIEKSVQLTDLFLEWIGCLIGYFGVLYFIYRAYHYSPIVSEITTKSKVIPGKTADFNITDTHWTRLPVEVTGEQYHYLKTLSDSMGKSLSGSIRFIISQFITELEQDVIVEEDVDETAVMTGYEGEKKYIKKNCYVNIKPVQVEFLSELSTGLNCSISQTVQLIIDDYIKHQEIGQL